MTNTTNYFPKFSAVVQDFEIDKSIIKTIEELRKGTFDIPPEEIIKSDFGLFYYEKGCLFPAAVHINTFSYLEQKGINVSDIKKTHNDFNIYNEYFHKVHFVTCSTLKDAIQDKTEPRFKASQKQDGTFHYALIKSNNDNEIILNADDQLLSMCRNCIKIIEKKYKLTFGIEITPESMIKLRKISVESFKKYITINCFSNSNKPNRYPSNWRKISEQNKEFYNWKCQEQTCQCRKKNLDFKDEYKEYFHTHHKNMDKSNNTMLNLTVLCIACHAEQPNHAHIKSSTRYKEFIEIMKKLGCGPPPNQ